MLKENIIAKTLNAEADISADRSRCLRMRLNRNSCAGCIDQCRFSAITIAEDVVIAANRCSECMLCVSSCPSDCFHIRAFDFYALLGRLGKIESSIGPPVLGCRSNTKGRSHEKTFCFGFLSEEHLIALSVFMSHHLQLDMSGCADCRNRFVIDTLGKRIHAVEIKTSIGAADKIRLIENKRELDFRDVSYDRRGFFKALKALTRTQALGLLGDEHHDNEIRAYSTKTVPVKREILNRALKVLPEETRKAVMKNYYYTVDVADTCNDCFACIGMCPTGALKIETKKDDRALFFSAAFCNGCGLCESFCMNGSMILKKGFSRDDPFEFLHAKKERPRGRC